MKTKSKIKICRVLFVLGLVNFLVFYGLAVYLGGDAFDGKIQDGHFFLLSHGRYTEVSEFIFNYSKWHVYSVFITHPLAIAASILSRRYRKQLDQHVTSLE